MLRQRSQSLAEQGVCGLNGSLQIRKIGCGGKAAFLGGRRLENRVLREDRHCLIRTTGKAAAMDGTLTTCGFLASCDVMKIAMVLVVVRGRMGRMV